jgi:thiol-disulfide isomerase/thioredoxin
MKPRALLLPVVALLCGAAGFFAYQRWLQPSATLRAITVAPGTSAAAPAATTLTAAGDATAARAVPEAVPDLKLKDLNGKTHALSEFKGAATIYNFWATWCAPCRREIPLLNQLYAKHRAEKLQLVGVAVDFRDDVQKFLKTTPISYLLLTAEQDGAETAAKFGMELVLPFSVFASSGGQIVAVKVGELHLREADAILAAIRSLEAGQTSLAQARAQITTRLRQFSIERATSGR